MARARRLARAAGLAAHLSTAERTTRLEAALDLLETLEGWGLGAGVRAELVAATRTEV